MMTELRSEKGSTGNKLDDGMRVPMRSREIGVTRAGARRERRYSINYYGARSPYGGNGIGVGLAKLRCWDFDR